ncbi:unnamed protein product [Ceratitis capitata]|uniref:(Mediterranean fruit fly) hypothetical protein n=1 Tax=Ceratitis capitata TaxID=7213 RepID=A0A811V499_CERCA|nr:unnamed protein product [Ceratitis capitata]
MHDCVCLACINGVQGVTTITANYAKWCDEVDDSGVALLTHDFCTHDRENVKPGQRYIATAEIQARHVAGTQTAADVANNTQRRLSVSQAQKAK